MIERPQQKSPIIVKSVLFSKTTSEYFLEYYICKHVINQPVIPCV